LQIYLVKCLPPNVQGVTSSVSHFSMFESSTWAHILGYCLYHPSTHEVIASTSVIFYDIIIDPRKYGDNLYVLGVGGFIVETSAYCDVRHNSQPLVHNDICRPMTTWF
jgi:hypothetical protein